MEFPVDVLEATSHGELERSAHIYMNELLYADPDHAHYITLPSGKEVQISLSSVGFAPLYGANLQHKVLALFSPQDQLTAVALFLANRWYSMEDILKTANSKRDGLIKVRSVGERIVLYVLNRIVYRTNEMGSGEMPFLCHGENAYAKILWKNGQAVGFFSVKPKGSVCNNSLGQCYFLPVMDSIFVRKAHRGKGYGLQMLEDFVDSFNEDELGLKYPLSPAMTNVCRNYLDRYPADVDLFWEVESVGGPYQRTRVAYKLSSKPLNDTHKGGHGDGSGQNGDVVEDEVEESEESCLNVTEEVIVVNKHHKVTEELDTPISTRTRSSEHRRRKRVHDEEEAKRVESRPEKINRMEITEEEKKEFIPNDGVAAQSMPEDSTESPTVEVNCKQAEDKQEVKEGAEEEDESAIQNGSGGEEREEMEVEEVAEESEAPVQKDDTQTMDTLEEQAAELQEADAATENNQEMEVDPMSHLQHSEEDSPAAEKNGVAINLQKDTTAAPADKKPDIAPADEEQQEVAPATEEEQEVPHAAQEKQEAAPVPEGKQEVSPANMEEVVVAPVSEEEQEGAPATEKEDVVASVAEEVQEEAPAAKGKQDEVAVAVEEQEGALSVDGVQDVAPEAAENEVDPAVEEEQEVAPELEKIEDNEVDPEDEKQEVDPPTDETSSSLATDSEDISEEAADVVYDIEVTALSDQSSKKDERQPSGEDALTLMLEEEEAAQKEDETDEEGEVEVKNVKEASDISRVLRGARTRTVPPTSKRTSKRLSKMTLEDEEEEHGEAKVVDEDKGMSTEEEKVTTEEEEAEHSSEEEEQVQDPPVIDKRVLRGKTKVIQITQRTRGKRRGKM
ncbi:soluble lamin-associated protein of 75 kDa isoform X2 [Hemibagrus wyckioides]|uniref:soluble lamin-associated protein of 75 kDa isoform X2 n=1 Tax=Hemibagrus wyckioides TaxID=337641 RepID=UPI00266D1829|nr:soluble lamin-associated protein of 75 kDa isoform X2 [Hemibagrus wyckioides]